MKAQVNPKSTSNQSSKPCRVLQYPSRIAPALLGVMASVLLAARAQCHRWMSHVMTHMMNGWVMSWHICIRVIQVMIMSMTWWICIMTCLWHHEYVMTWLSMTWWIWSWLVWLWRIFHDMTVMTHMMMNAYSSCHRQVMIIFIMIMTCMTHTGGGGAGVETQKNVRGEVGGWGRVPFNEPYAPSLSTIYDGA